MPGRHRLRARWGVALAALALAAPAGPAAGAADAEAGPDADAETGAGAGAPDDASARELLAELRTLYRALGAAADAHRATTAELRKQRARVREQAEELAQARTALAERRDRVGRLARQQYQAGGVRFTPTLRLLLGEDPATALRHGAALERAAAEEAQALRELSERAERARQLAVEERATLDKRQKLAERRKRQKKEARAQLDEVTRLLAELGDDDGLAEAENAAAARADDQRSAVRPLRAASPSAAGARAVAYARQQLGAPYRWGADGPEAFDGAGLARRAWAEAGERLPATSRRMWRRLPRVPLDELRPGDLVVYFRDATDVALYVGDGTVLRAAPGSPVRHSPLTAHPLRGALRPDG